MVTLDQVLACFFSGELGSEYFSFVATERLSHLLSSAGVE